MEPLDTYPSLFWGYSVIWIILVALIFRLVFRLRAIERNLSALGRDE